MQTDGTEAHASQNGVGGAAARAAPPLRPDVDAAIVALEALRPDCAWTLSAIGNDGIKTLGFHGHVQKDEVRQWIASQQGARRNVYFAPNRSRDPSRRASEADIVEVLYLHVDLDPEGPAATHSEQRERFTRALHQHNATAIIASGRGMQALWRLTAPIDASLAKRANKAIAAALGGDSGHDVARILRVPGTVNFPNAKKAAQGCAPVLAAAVELSERTMTFDAVLAAFGLTRATLPELSPARAPKATGAARPVRATADAGAPGPGAGGDGAAPFSLDDLPRLFGPTGAEIARTFKDKNGRRYLDRSAGSFEFALAASRWKAPPGLAVAALLDRRLPISDHIYDAGPTGNRTAEDYARKQVDDAIAKVALEREDLALLFPDVPEGFDVTLPALSADAVREAAELRVQLFESPLRLGSTILSKWEGLSLDVFDCAPAPLRFLLDAPGGGLLPRGKLALVGGEGGAGKSTLALQLGVSLATGLPWLGRFPVGADQLGRVLILAGEEDRDDVLRRLWMVADSMQLDTTQREAVVASLVIAPLAGLTAPLVALHNGRVVPTDELRALREKLQEDGGPWSAIVVDPLSRFGSADVEKDNSVATQNLQHLESLTTAPGRPAVLVLTHSSKDIRRQKDVDIRGVSGLVDAARSVLLLRQDDKRDDVVWLRRGKANYSRRVTEELALRRRPGGLLWAETPLEQEARGKAEAAAQDAVEDDRRRRASRRVGRGVDEALESVLRVLAAAPGPVKSIHAIAGLAKMRSADASAAVGRAVAEQFVERNARSYQLTETGRARVGGGG